MGKMRQATKHDTVAKVCGSCRLNPTPHPKRLEVNGRESEEENLNKPEMFEIALKQNLPVNFESFPLKQVARESGPPHMSSSVTRVSGGVLVGKAKGRARGFQRKHY